MSSNISKKISELVIKELSGFFDHLLEKIDTEEDSFSFDKESLDIIAKEYFGLKEKLVKEKIVKEKLVKEKKILTDEERCSELKKDGNQCSGRKTTLEIHKDTKFGSMCSLHINAAKKNTPKSVVDSPPFEIEEPQQKKHKQKKPEIIESESF